MKAAALAILVPLLLGPAAVLSAPQAAPAAPASQTATVSWLGFTNLSAGATFSHSGRFATLCITNPISIRFACVPLSVEYQTNGTWVTNALTGRWQSWVIRKWESFDNDYPVSAARVFYVPPPVTNGAWRLRFMCVEHAQGLPGLRDQVEDLAANLTPKTNGASHMTRFSGKSYSIVSPGIQE